MAPRSLILAAGLLVVACGAGAQTPPPPALPPAPIQTPDRVPTAPRVVFDPAVVPSLPTGLSPAAGIPTPPSLSPALPEPPAEKTLEQILKELEAVQAQKADILKKEADLKVVAQKKLTELQKKLDQLGATLGAKAGEPHRVGQILLDGFAKKDQEKVLEAVGMRSGQIILYPHFEAARERIETLGFKGVEVLPVANPTDPATLRDILIRMEKNKN